MSTSSSSPKPAPLAGLRVLDFSILGPGATAHHFAEWVQMSSK
jgi:hypothetical protein